MSIFSKPKAHNEQCELAAAAIEAGDFTQALIHVEQARTALHPEGVETTVKCEYLAALCFTEMYDLSQAKERLAEAWKLSPIRVTLKEGGVSSAEDDEIIQRLANLAKRIREMDEAGVSSTVMLMPELASTEEIPTAPEPETAVMNFNAAVEAITAGTATTTSQLHAIRDAISFALSDDSTQLDSEAEKHLARGLLSYCNWRLDHRPATSLSALILKRRALRRLGDVDYEEILVDCILETPLTRLQRYRYVLRLVSISSMAVVACADYRSVGRYNPILTAALYGDCPLSSEAGFLFILALRAA